MKKLLVVLVNLIAWPIGKALDEIDFGNLTRDDASPSLRDEASPIDRADFTNLTDDDE